MLLNICTQTAQQIIINVKNIFSPCKEYKFSQTKVSQTHCTVMTSSPQKSIIPHYLRHGPASYWRLKFRSMWMGSHSNSPVLKNVLAHHGASVVANLPSPCSSEHTVFPGTSIFSILENVKQLLAWMSAANPLWTLSTQYIFLPIQRKMETFIQNGGNSTLHAK